MGFLDAVPSGQEFGFSDKSANSLISLYDIVSTGPDELFSMHVTDQKNDFANWILGVIKHQALFDKVSKTKTKQEFLAVLKTEIDVLKNPPSPVSSTASSQTSVSSTPVAPSVSSPAPLTTESSSSATPSVPVATVSSPSEEHFEYEDVLKEVIEEIDKDVDTDSN